MALPTLQRKLFQNDGYGPLLKDEIVSKHISVQDWTNAYDYPVATVVRGGDGVLYYSVAQSGPNVGGAQDPTVDVSHTYWIAPKVPTMPVDGSSKAAVNSEWVENWREQNTARTDVYVDMANGSDSNDGSQGSPFKTIEKAQTYLSNVHFINRGVVNIHVASGDYTSDANVSGVSGVQAKYIFSPGSIVSNIEPIGNDKTVLVAGSVIVDKGYVIPTRSATVLLCDNVSITFRNSNRPGCFGATVDSLLALERNYTTINLIFDNCSPSGAVCYCMFNSAVIVTTATINISGSATGKRYTVNCSSTVYKFGSPTVIPGSTAGFVDDTSYYS